MNGVYLGQSLLGARVALYSPQYTGRVFRDISMEPLYPTISLSPGTNRVHVQANFGQYPFSFDLAKYIAPSSYGTGIKSRDKIRSDLSIPPKRTVQPSKEKSNKLFVGAEVAYKLARPSQDVMQWLQCNITGIRDIGGEKK